MKLRSLVFADNELCRRGRRLLTSGRNWKGHDFGCMSCSPPLDNIRVMVIVWRLRGNIIRAVLCWIVRHNVHSPQHTYMSSSYRSNRLGLSHWDPYAVRRGGCLELYYCNMVEWFWCDSSLISTTNWFPSVLWHCWFGHLVCKNRPRNDLLCVEWDVNALDYYYCVFSLGFCEFDCQYQQNSFSGKAVLQSDFVGTLDFAVSLVDFAIMTDRSMSRAVDIVDSSLDVCRLFLLFVIGVCAAVRISISAARLLWFWIMPHVSN